MTERAILDASAVVVLALGESGAEAVVPLLDASVVSAVNLAETIDVLSRRRLDDRQVRRTLDSLALHVMAFDETLARRTGELAAQTRHLGLSLGDRACLALAERLQGFVVTADRRLKEAAVGVEIRVIR